LRDVIAAIEEGREPAVTGEDGLRAVQLVESIYVSNAKGVPIHPEEVLS
jgi:predicted dehydrogenase